MGSHDTDTVEFVSPPIAAAKYFVRSAGSLTFDFGAASHAGLCRTQNQDQYLVLRRSRTQELLLASVSADELPAHPWAEAFAMAVADGMGGTSCGNLASQLAMRAAWEIAGTTTSWLMRIGTLNASELRERIEGFTYLMQQTFLDEFQTNPKFGDSGTTWTCAYLADTFAIVAQVGDSPCFRWRDGTMAQISVDHTIEQEFLAAGVDPEVAGKCRNLLTRCFGAQSPNARPDVYHLRIKAGDQLLLCTDGLTDMVRREQIAKCLDESPDPQTACNGLVELALSGGGKDNVTVVLARAKPL